MDEGMVAVGDVMEHLCRDNVLEFHPGILREVEESSK